MSLAYHHRSGSVEAATRALERISVRAPYFDLQDLVVDDTGTVRALVPLSPPDHPETGLMEAAQVFRHLAILGSCALALQRDDDNRHHYLATRAHFLRAANLVHDDLPGGRPGCDSVGPLVVGASGTWLDRRSARALAKLYGAAGQLSHVLDVHYTVMTPRKFGLTMPSIDEGELGPVDHAGTEAYDVEVGVEVGDGEGLAVDCGPIPLEMCAGHFPDYPAAPMALVMGRLARAAGLAMNRHLGFGDLTYSIDEARVVATKLAHAGQRLTLTAGYERRVGAGHLLVGAARADGEVIGEMELTLSVTSLPEPLPFPIGALA